MWATFDLRGFILTKITCQDQILIGLKQTARVNLKLITDMVSVHRDSQCIVFGDRLVRYSNK